MKASTRKVRRAAIAEAYKSGLTMEEVGAKFEIGKQAVYMILRKEGVSKSDGGKRKRFELKSAALDEQRNAECLKRWGCTWEQFSPLAKIKGPNRPVARFGDHRKNASHRGIKFELTFWQWWTIWQDSGRWAERGKQGYVMCRKGDLGPYAVGNVFIALGTENSSDRPHNKNRLPMGVRREKSRYRDGYIAIRRVNRVHHHLGFHLTPELAHAAYLACVPQTDIVRVDHVDHCLSPVSVENSNPTSGDSPDVENAPAALLIPQPQAVGAINLVSQAVAAREAAASTDYFHRQRMLAADNSMRIA